MYELRSYVEVVDSNAYRSGEIGKVISIDYAPYAAKPPIIAIRFPDGKEMTYDGMQIDKSPSKLFCDVCQNNWDNHLLLKCDGVSCIYCHQLWSECNCGR
jgi:hypothetical protein